MILNRVTNVNGAVTLSSNVRARAQTRAEEHIQPKVADARQHMVNASISPKSTLYMYNYNVHCTVYRTANCTRKEQNL